MSIEGGVRGNQQRLVCPSCGQAFFAWRPDDLPGQKIKCYFCRTEFADEAAQRTPPAPIASPPAAAPQPAEPPAQPAAPQPAEPPAPPAPPASGESVAEPPSES